MTLKLSQKQKKALDLLDDPQVTDLLFGGGGGGGKSVLVCIWMILQCRDYPGIRIALCRKELNRLKETTVVTLLRKAHLYVGVTKDEYVYNSQQGFIRYINGSEIQLVGLVWQPSDPEYDTYGSLEYTHVVLEECGELIEKARTVISSRKNRYLNDEYGIVGKTVLTTNPSQNFVRSEFYEPYKALGAGEMQVWPHGDVYVNGERMEARKAFIRALVTDNPFASKNYVEELKRKPPLERKRLYLGLWDYAEDDDMLFKTTLLDRSMISDLPQDVKSKFIGVDVSDKGPDSTIATLVEDGIVTRQKKLIIDKTGEKPLSELYALELIKFAQQNGFTAQDAKNIAIEGNGVGVGMRDFMRAKGWMITVYEATSKSRSESFYSMHLSMDAGDLKLWLQLESLDELRRQLMIHTYDIGEDLKPRILEKKKVKQQLGHSPDEADSLNIAHWIMKGGNVDPSDDWENHISW